jgi:2-haloacid dehalogenase
MQVFKPKYITFDCYGTLTNFQMSAMTREMFRERIPVDGMDTFVRDFAAYRFDEVLGAWKPYADVISNALERTCKRWHIEFRRSEAETMYRAVPAWGPHPDVPEPLAEVAKHYPLVILSNASDDQIHSNVDKLGAPFHAVYTAQQAQAYKPRLQAFEYMLDHLGCAPADLLHVSSSLRYDLMSAHDLRIGKRVFVSRGHEPSTSYYGYEEIADIRGLPTLLGL